jgi:flagellar P-ring protein precursor FlgI
LRGEVEAAGFGRGGLSASPNAWRLPLSPRTSVGVAEDGRKFAVVKDGVSLQQLVDGLNGLGIGPRDLIGILQAIKAAGAIQADIEVM